MRLQHTLPDEAEGLLRHRVAIVNVWRPIKSPVHDAALAVCDARSVASRERIRETSVARFSVMP
jgi:hypothetical protein